MSGNQDRLIKMTNNLWRWFWYKTKHKKSFLQDLSFWSVYLDFLTMISLFGLSFLLSVIIINRKNIYLNLTLPTSSRKYQHDSRNLICVAERHKIKLWYWNTCVAIWCNKSIREVLICPNYALLWRRFIVLAS